MHSPWPAATSQNLMCSQLTRWCSWSKDERWLPLFKYKKCQYFLPSLIKYDILTKVCSGHRAFVYYSFDRNMFFIINVGCFCLLFSVYVLVIVYFQRCWKRGRLIICSGVRTGSSLSLLAWEGNESYGVTTFHWPQQNLLDERDVVETFRFHFESEFI